MPLSRRYLAREAWLAQSEQMCICCGLVNPRSAEGNLGAELILDAWFRRRTMRQYRKRHVEEITLAVERFTPVLDEARAAIDRGDMARARELWQPVLAACPAIVAASTKAALLAIEIEDSATADSLIRTALQDFPNRVFLWEMAAFIAKRRNDYEGAFRHYDAMRRQAPNVPNAYVGLADSAMALGRPQEAEAALAKGMRGTSGSVHIHFRRARLAEERQDWPAAEQRWRGMWKEFEDPRAAVAAAECCMRRGDLQAADALLRQAVEAVPEAPDVWRAYARLAGQRGDAAEQARRWEAARLRHPALVPDS
ncbi:MAG TPA: tetratricopeptide repeat protein [Acetobacteraceae bacterium]|nr:tetratricopeptide repeat protein [Acetobacteraceae bacterium]